MNILLAVTGLSPQVITETVYALHQNARRVDAIHVITTREGRDKIYAELLSGKGGKFHKYIEDYCLESEPIDFGYDNIHVVRDEHGMEIADIVDEFDNEQLLRKCLELAFRFTNDPENTVFFSVAGGRKTMSSCLSFAAQMYGREQDRLYHVLVSPDFEGSREFYYPPPESVPIELNDRQGQTFYKETKYAAVNLIHIPFFSIRDQLSSDLLKEPKDPGTLMLSLVKEEQHRLSVNLMSRKIIYKTLELDLMPAHLALYAFFALQKKKCTKKVNTCGTCTECFIGLYEIFEKQAELTEIYRKISSNRPMEKMSDTGISQLNSENFNMYKGKLKAQLLHRFGPYALKDIEISSEGARPNTRYGIRADKGRIEIVY